MFYDKFAFYRQFMSRQIHSFFSRFPCNAVHLKKNHARFDRRYIVINTALAFSHRDLSALLRYRPVREYPDPDLAAPLGVLGHYPAGRLNLPGRYPMRFHGLKAELPEADRYQTAGLAASFALVAFSK